jgi:hypothetical protein
MTATSSIRRASVLIASRIALRSRLDTFMLEHLRRRAGIRKLFTVP